MDFVITILLTQNILVCYGASLKQQLDHIERNRMENLGYSDLIPGYRRYLSFHPGQKSLILGAPSMPSHLPEAEPILPGHTLIRPALGMLKSAIKFPHTEWDSGTGVYGNTNNLGITWDGTNDRVLYTGFRRFSNDYQLLPHKNKSPKSMIIILLNNPNEQKKELGYKKLRLPRQEKSEFKQNDAIKELLYKLLRDARRKDIQSTEEDSSDPDNPPNNLKLNPKLTWLLDSKDTYNHKDQSRCSKLE